MKNITKCTVFFIVLLLFPASSLLYAQADDASPGSFESETQFREYLEYVEKEYRFCSGSYLGDVNDSGSIDIIDALLVAQYYVGLLNIAGMPCGNVNNDGETDIVDALMIARYYVGLIATDFGTSSPVAAAASDYSETNLQEAGVDEADLVKTDGSYIYAISDRTLVINRAYPAEETALINSIRYTDGFAPIELFLTGNTLVVIGSFSFRRSIPESYQVSGNVYNYRTTMAIVYDITDRENLITVRTVELDGAYLTSRRIGNILYLLTHRSLFAYGKKPVPFLEAPVYRDSLLAEDFVSLSYSQIDYFPFLVKADFLNAAALDLADNSRKLNVSAYILPVEDIYVSGKSIYTAYCHMRTASAGLLSWFPVIPADRKSYLFKIKLDGLNMVSGGTGIIPGNVLNRYSMSEYNNFFRVAVTTGDASSVNSVYVLDAEMQIAGSLEGLAPGEKIYSARFIGDKGYLVTFRKIDPLFVIDLKNPEQPAVLGELKIPGYSDFLQPYDETHLIGIGKDTKAADTGNFAWFQGIKLAIFDVSDVHNPVQLHQEIIGHRGTDSEALRDPKSFLFSRQKNLFVIPVTVCEFTTEPQYESQTAPATYQGAYIYNISLETGFTLKGRITHNDPDPDSTSGGYLMQARTIRRSLYIENALYTLSFKRLMVNDLDGLAQIKLLTY